MRIFRGLRPRRRRTQTVQRAFVAERRRLPVYKRVWFIAFLFVVGVLVISSIAYFVFFSAFFKITEIQVEHDRVTVQTTFNPSFFSSLIGNNIFLVSEADVQSVVAQISSPVKSISLRRKFPSTLVIELVGHPVVARTKWLGGDYYITEDGFLVSSSRDESLVLPFITLNIVSQKVTDEEDTSEASILSFGQVFSDTFSDRVVDPRDLQTILLLLERFRQEFELEILEASYSHVAHEVAIRTLSGTTILFDLSKSLDNQFYKLWALSKKFKFADGKPSRVDLRIGEDRIFYTE